MANSTIPLCFLEQLNFQSFHDSGFVQLWATILPTSASSVTAAGKKRHEFAVIRVWSAHWKRLFANHHHHHHQFQCPVDQDVLLLAHPVACRLTYLKVWNLRQPWINYYSTTPQTKCEFFHLDLENENGVEPFFHNDGHILEGTPEIRWYFSQWRRLRQALDQTNGMEMPPSCVPLSLLSQNSFGSQEEHDSNVEKLASHIYHLSNLHLIDIVFIHDAARDTQTPDSIPSLAAFTQHIKLFRQHMTYWTQSTHRSTAHLHRSYHTTLESFLWPLIQLQCRQCHQPTQPDSNGIAICIQCLTTCSSSFSGGTPLEWSWKPIVVRFKKAKDHVLSCQYLTQSPVLPAGTFQWCAQNGFTMDLFALSGENDSVAPVNHELSEQPSPRMSTAAQWGRLLSEIRSMHPSACTLAQLQSWYQNLHGQLTRLEQWIDHAPHAPWNVVVLQFTKDNAARDRHGYLLSEPRLALISKRF